MTEDPNHLPFGARLGIAVLVTGFAWGCIAAYGLLR
jgi:hypothetical protein